MLELTTNLLVEIGGWPALKEARGLLERGKVSNARQEGPVIRARVQGAEKIHEPSITLADRAANVEVRCTCAEFRRAGRVCPHALAAGLAILQPTHNREMGSRRTPGGGPTPAKANEPSPSVRRLPRFPLEEAPANTPQLELTLLLPLQLAEALSKDPIRVILEARRVDDASPQPFDAIIPQFKNGFAVSDDDERLLAALEKTTGTVSGITAVPRARIGSFFHALGNHPRIWLGKKQRISLLSSSDLPQITLQTQPDGTLELTAAENPTAGSRRTPGGGPLPNWTFDGHTLTESPSLPPGFSSKTRLIPREKIPEFLSREFPALERTCALVFAPGFEEFQLEIAQPVFIARLEGALSGLTLELFSRYGEKDFPLTGKEASSVYQHYFSDSSRPNRFWRRNVLAERAALAQVDAAGFSLVRPNAASFSLTQENHVARFLANTLPRWRQNWEIQFGSRLEETLKNVDIARPEFSLRPAAGNDWLSLDLKLSVDGKPVPLDTSEIQRWLQTGQSHARTPDKRTLLIPTEAWGEMQEVLADCAVEQEPGQIRVAKQFAPFLSGALAANGFFSGNEKPTDIAPPDLARYLDPALLEKLRPYQKHGVEWLASLAQQNFHALLADDMGLGKTIQALAFAAWLKATPSVAVVYDRRSTEVAADVPIGGPSHGVRRLPILVVCPTSLVTNWLREAARFTPHLRPLDLTGADRAQKISARHDYDLLVTSYAILRRDIDLYRADQFSLVVLDEAQHIKNRASQNAQAAKALRAQHRLILSGTPLENSILDLWSLFDFLLPGYLGTAADFRERYETPLTQEKISGKAMERLRHRVKPFFLRRTKQEVLTELPPKLENLTVCELSHEQREVYRAILDQGRRDVFENSDKAGRKSGRDRLAVLTTLLRLRQVSCHLDLLPSGDATRTWKEPSAKLDRTFELIEEAVDGGHRVLLFSQFVKMLHLLRDEAVRRKINFCYLDGQTVERQAEVDRFQNNAGIPLFFISLKAGGTGLNLTGADTVIHFDPWWNPAVEEQATSRAHRMGQSRSVTAYKLIAAGTVEEKIQALQSRKRELFEASLGGDEAFVNKLTGDDLEELLSE